MAHLLGRNRMLSYKAMRIYSHNKPALFQAYRSFSTADTFRVSFLVSKISFSSKIWKSSSRPHPRKNQLKITLTSSESSLPTICSRLTGTKKLDGETQSLAHTTTLIWTPQIRRFITLWNVLREWKQCLHTTKRRSICSDLLRTVREWTTPSLPYPSQVTIMRNSWSVLPSW